MKGWDESGWDEEVFYLNCCGNSHAYISGWSGGKTWVRLYLGCQPTRRQSVMISFDSDKEAEAAACEAFNV